MTNRTSDQDRYRDAGVDIDAGERFVSAIGPAARATARPGAAAALGGFGGLFDVKAAGYLDPILVAATDGVGTKLKLAFELDAHDRVGIDLVAMCVNDLLAQGAEPLFFLDYFACGRLRPDVAERVVLGIAQGCKAAGCALIGGETAEMPGMYAGEEYDIAGFAVGAFERGEGLPRADLAAGDVLLGLASSGVHSNGFSLVRKILTETGCDLTAPAPFDASRTLGAALMEPTRIYVAALSPEIRAGRVKALAHITGGGLTQNIPRVLPAHLRARLDEAALPRAPVFDWLQSQGGLSTAEMRRTFNCGVGAVAVVAPADADGVSAALEAAGESVRRIGVLAEAA